MFSGGMRTVLSKRGNNELGLRADAFAAQLGADASDDIATVRGETHRARLMAEWVHDTAFSAGRSLSLKVEAGGRLDGGDADRGSGAETGFRLGYLDANSGLDMALQGRALVVHGSDYRDWGVGVQASWDPGEKQRGFRMSVASARGQDGGGRTTLWNNANTVTRPMGMSAMGMNSQNRMESEVAYGMDSFGGRGLLTPYTRLRWSQQGRELAMGTTWSLPARTQFTLPLMFELEAMRRERSSGHADLAVLLRMSIPLGGSGDFIPGPTRVSLLAPQPARQVAASAPKWIPCAAGESGAAAPQFTAAAPEPPAESVSAPQQDADLLPEPATPEPASPASQPAQASAQPQGAPPPPTATAPAKGEGRVVHVQPTPRPDAKTTPQLRSAALPTQAAELQAQTTPPQAEPRRQAPPGVPPPAAPAPIVSPGGGIVVQVGAFRSPERAGRLTDELRQKGHAAITIGGSDYHRVVVGPFPNRSGAASAHSQLEQQGYQGYVRAGLGRLLEPPRLLATAAEPPAKPYSAPQKNRNLPPEPVTSEPRRQAPPAVPRPAAPAPTVSPGGGIVVQVGAFRSPERAGRLTDELRQKGHAAITIGGSDYHRVVVGPFPNRSGAASAHPQLEQQGYQGYVRAGLGRLLEPARLLRH